MSVAWSDVPTDSTKLLFLLALIYNRNRRSRRLSPSSSTTRRSPGAASGNRPLASTGTPSSSALTGGNTVTSTSPRLRPASTTTSTRPSRIRPSAKRRPTTRRTALCPTGRANRSPSTTKTGKSTRPRTGQSFTYSQSGFKLKNTSGRTRLWLSKIGDIPITFHRDLPDDATIKTIAVKREPTGKWYAILGVETSDDPPEKPDEGTDAVGIDVGILKYVHDSDGLAVESPDLSDERERLERAQRNLSRKEHGSNNWAEQRKTVARRHADLKRKRRDFLHKLSAYYAREYDLVAVEDLDAKGLVELPGNSRNRAGASWGTFLRMLEYNCKREGTYFVAVDPRGTTKECASCGVETDKPLWVREHSCPSCGFEADRDANAVVRLRLTGSKIATRFLRRRGTSFLAVSTK